MAAKTPAQKLTRALDMLIAAASDAETAAKEWAAAQPRRDGSDGVSQLRHSGYDDVYEVVTTLEQLHARVVIEVQTAGEIAGQVAAEPERTCAHPGDTEHDHEMCNDVVAERQTGGAS